MADGAYAREKLEEALKKMRNFTLEVLKRPKEAKEFVLIPRRWVVERTLAWLSRARRLAKDVEETIKSFEAWVWIANISRLVQRITILQKSTD
jgi:transposase